MGFAFSSELSYFRPSIVSLNPTYETIGDLLRSAFGIALPSAFSIPPTQFQSMCMVRSPKSSGGAVGVRLGNAPYQIGDLLRSAFGIALVRQ
ncbi:MAG: hypothetical protein ACKPKN_03120 [Microcystis panniformis]